MSDRENQACRKVMENLDKFTAWSECYFEALGLISAEEYSDAIKALNEAESRVDSFKTVNRAQIAERLGYCYHKSGNLAEAERYYELALTFATTPLYEKMFEMNGTENLTSPEEQKAAASVQLEMHRLREKFRADSKKVIGDVLDAVEKNFGELLVQQKNTDRANELTQRLAKYRSELLG